MTKTAPDFPGQTITVELGRDSYPIYVGSQILPQFGGFFVHHCGRRRVVVVTDDNVGPLYGQSVIQTLNSVDIRADMITVKAGEPSKRMSVVEAIYDQLFDFSIERSDAIVALGGGVVGDLAGFVAATFKRGVSFVQLPTSLLAMVDSSIGGKTGINHPRGKNMIGAFYQPKLVFADTSVLKTLPPRELGCGLAETVKHAIIRDGVFFEHLEKYADEIMDLQPELMVDLVVRNCRIKAEVVSADERESGLRGILNFGHTIGHTLETVLADHDYHHGEAVAMGMVAASRLAVQRDIFEDRQAARILKLLGRFNLPTVADKPLPPDQLYEAMKHDKKVQDGKIKFVLPTSLGDCTFVSDLTESAIKAAIRQL